jgi:predicted metal-dependent RNase
MSDEQQTQSQEHDQPTPSPFVEELSKLGRNFSQLIKEALESPQLQEVRKEVSTSAQTVIEEINEAMVKARESEVTKTVAQKAAQTAEELKTSPVTQNIKVGLLNALRSVNEELSDIVQKMEQNFQQAAATETTEAQPETQPEAETSSAAEAPAESEDAA